MRLLAFAVLEGDRLDAVMALCADRKDAVAARDRLVPLGIDVSLALVEVDEVLPAPIDAFEPPSHTIILRRVTEAP